MILHSALAACFGFGDASPLHVYEYLYAASLLVFSKEGLAKVLWPGCPAMGTLSGTGTGFSEVEYGTYRFRGLRQCVIFFIPNVFLHSFLHCLEQVGLGQPLVRADKKVCSLKST